MSPLLSTLQPRRILVRGVNWLGDAVLTLPAVQRLRERFPRAAICLLSHEKLKDLWCKHPLLDELLTFSPGESVLTIGRRLRDREFDLAIILPNSPRSALEAWLARVSRRVGYGGRWRQWLLSDVVAQRPGAIKMHKRSAREIHRLIHNLPRSTSGFLFQGGIGVGHHVHQYLHLVRALGASAEPISPLLFVSEHEMLETRSRLLGDLSPSRRLVALNPSAAYGQAKRWPIENFAAVIKNVSGKHPEVAWIALGGREDAALCEQLRSLSGVLILNLATHTSLRELMAVLKLSGVMLTNDSGPMHLAAALGTPVVVPFGSTSPELTGPILDRRPSPRVFTSDAACAPCFRRECPVDFRCMTSISPEQVSHALLEILQSASAREACSLATSPTEPKR